jgi:glutathionylspermidine synthase
MNRRDIKPRADYVRIIESQGLLWHSLNQGGIPYWTEDSCYSLDTKQVDEIEAATLDLNEKCLEAVEYVLSNEETMDSFEIYSWFRPILRDAWKNEELTIIGRFDFSYDGDGPPKLLEFNADTPTGLVEQSVIQWHWLQDMAKSRQVTGDAIDQFNSTHERLIEAWDVARRFVGDGTMYFTSLDAGTAVEDYITVNYLRDAAIQAGLKTEYVAIDKLGWDHDAKRFVDEANNPVKFLMKLYPFEWLCEEEIGKYLKDCPPANLPRFLEAPWKALLSNKALLVLLHEMFPKSPYILKASYEKEDIGRTYVKKPQFSREGANITIVEKGQTTLATDGEYGSSDLWIYQDYCPLPEFDGHYPVLGSWLVNGYATGVGIREADSLITGNLSRFVPHYFDNRKPGFFSRIFG